MTKTQKVWLGIFLAMFVVPEVLWSPVGNFIYELLRNSGSPFRNTFLEKNDNINSLSIVLFIQVLGLLFSSIYIIIIRKGFKNKVASWVLSTLLFFAAVVVFYLFYISITLGRNGIT